MQAVRGSRSRQCLSGVLVLGALLAGCGGIPEEAYRLPPTSLDVREAQSRTYDVPDETNILQASVALMQDMEYNFDTIEYPLGVLSGSKVVDADSILRNAGLLAADIVIAVLSLGGAPAGGGLYAGADDKVNLTATLVVLPSLEDEGRYTARITIRSESIDKANRVKKVRMIENPEVYQEIFEKLSKSLFLEGVR